MLKWLKKRLRLFGKGKPVSREIMVCSVFSEDNKYEKVTAEVTVGVYLQCTNKEGNTLLVNKHTAKDPEHFTKLWRELGGSGFVWEDGTPYDPNEVTIEKLPKSN